MPYRDLAVCRVLGPPNQSPSTSNHPIIHHSEPSVNHLVAETKMTPRSSALVWFRGHDLRIHDHAALDAAIRLRAPVVALYVLERGAETDGLASFKYAQAGRSASVSSSSLHFNETPVPSTPNGGFSLGRVQRWYLHHSLTVLQQQLANLGITLVLRRVDCAEDTASEIASIARALGARAVFWNKRCKPRAYPLDNAVRASLRQYGIIAHDFLSETLLEPSVSRCGRFNDFQSYNRFWMTTMRHTPPERPKPEWRPEDVCALPADEVQQLLEAAAISESHPNVQGQMLPQGTVLPSVQHLELLKGLQIEGDDSPGDIATIGCVAAKRTLKSFLQDERLNRFSSGAARRDGMLIGKQLATSRLSPHIRFGEISPRVLFYAIVDAGAQAKENGNEKVLDAACTFLKNMSLREFGYYMLVRYPSAGWKPIIPEFEVFPWAKDENGELMLAWETGTTGFPIVDAAMRQLIREGWIHNRMRFLAASFFCKYLLLPWPLGAAHMVRTLVDGDEACNSLGWQWTAGCNSDSFPFSTLVNPVSLYSQCRSTKDAAAYVRKYVPELSTLPDHLIFTPWRATSAECEKYEFSLVVRSEYQNINRRWSPSRQLQQSPVNLYPCRIVNGSEARFRARNAMEVMRRIFSAQRQCRTLIVEQYDEDHVRKARRSNAVDIQLLEDSSQVTRVSTEEVSKAKKRKRRTSLPETKEMSTSVKRQRHVATPDVALSDSTSHVSNATARISRSEVDLLLSSSEAPATPFCRNKKRSSENRTSTGERGSPAPLARGNDVVQKRPRSSGPEGTPSSDERLSVKSLLTPQLPSYPHPKTSKREEFAQRYRALQNEQEQMRTLVQPAPSAVLQSPQVQARPVRNHRPISSPDITGNFPSPTLPSIHTPDHIHTHSISRLPHSPHLSASPQLATPTPQMHSPSPSPRIDLPLKSQFQQTRSGFSGTPPDIYGSRIPLKQNEEVPTENIRQQHQAGGQLYPRHVNVGQGSHVAAMTGIHQTQQKGAIVPAVNTPDARSVASNIVQHHGVHQLQMSPEHFQAQQIHAAQMMVPFRGAGTPILGHQGRVMHHTQDGGAQPYFAVPTPIGMQHARSPNQQFMWLPHPAVPSLVEMQMSGIHGAPVQHLMPHIMPPHGSLHLGYSASGSSPQHASIVTHPNGHGRYPGPGPTPRRGPTTTLEREAIARRMAAMDYHDEAYGGKHWEQWQAIAIHLLDQYEFSEDTDRETSKAYTRLCVLKDELRDANPQGPRVTVNHCKEVFKILCLPVTGEWDRRGHGGVRGPYCYGCVKRSSLQQ